VGGPGEPQFVSNPFAPFDFEVTFGSLCEKVIPTGDPTSGDAAPPRLYAGFSSGDLDRIENARTDAVTLLTGIDSSVNIDDDCRTNLSARVFSGGRTINVEELIRMLAFSWRVKPATADETEWGPFDIINGGASRASDIQNPPGAGGYIDNAGRGIVLLTGFFNGVPGRRIDFDRSRGVALIHEAIHLQGIHDADFGGSANINTFIIQSCIDKNLSHNDLSIVVN
jgi:hypothetical protein